MNIADKRRPCRRLSISSERKVIKDYNLYIRKKLNKPGTGIIKINNLESV